MGGEKKKTIETKKKRRWKKMQGAPQSLTTKTPGGKVSKFVKRKVGKMEKRKKEKTTGELELRSAGKSWGENKVKNTKGKGGGSYHKPSENEGSK